MSHKVTNRFKQVALIASTLLAVLGMKVLLRGTPSLQGSQNRRMTRHTTDQPRGPLKPFTIDMQGTLKLDSGEPSPPPVLFHDTLTSVKWHGHKAMRRETANTAPGGTEFVGWATVIFDAKTLLPYYCEIRGKTGRFVRREFDGLHVKETLGSAPATLPVSEEFDLTEIAYTWIENSGLPILLASPLSAGFKASVPVLTGDPSKMTMCMKAPCYVRRMSYEVIGQETITGLSGRATASWKVWVPEVQFTFWIRCDKPRLEQVTWPGPGGTYSMSRVRRT